MKRLTYQTVGDAMHPQHYATGPGIRKDDLLQRLGKLEDAFTEIPHAMADAPARNAISAGKQKKEFQKWRKEDDGEGIFAAVPRCCSESKSGDGSP